MTSFTAGAFVYLNGRPIHRNVTQTPQELLKTLPKGAYTSLRVEKLRNVLNWELHVNRLNRSVELLSEKIPHSYPRVHPQGHLQQGLAQRLSDSLKASLTHFKSDSVTEEQDQIVIILVAPSTDAAENATDIYTYVKHAAPLTDHATPIKVWVKGRGRSIPEAKYSQWVMDRMPLEQQIPPDRREVILVNEQGGLLEGLTSSFYVIKSMGEGALLQTAGVEDGVLEGTFCRVMLEAIRSNGLPISVQQTCPLLSESATWTEAFISNSLTGIRPISEISVSEGDTIAFQAPGEMTQRLIQLTVAMHERTPLSDL